MELLLCTEQFLNGIKKPHLNYINDAQHFTKQGYRRSPSFSNF